jgi:hypothetical protein
MTDDGDDMKSVLLLTLIVCLVGSAMPAGAQEPMGTSAGPIHRAVVREVARLAARGEPTASVVETVQQGGAPAKSNWSRVRKLAPDTEIVVTVKGSPPTQRYFLVGDESDLTVLNVADPALPHTERGVLHDVASTHPEYFSAAQKGGQFVLENNVHVGPDGVFMADRKVADLAQVVQQYGREDIATIKTRQKGRGVWGHLGPLGGYFVGGMSGGMAAGFACQAAIGLNRCDNGAFLVGMVVGGIAGGVYGLIAANRETEDDIYRAR